MSDLKPTMVTTRKSLNSGIGRLGTVTVDLVLEGELIKSFPKGTEMIEIIGWLLEERKRLQEKVADSVEICEECLLTEQAAKVVELEAKVERLKLFEDNSDRRNYAPSRGIEPERMVGEFTVTLKRAAYDELIKGVGR